MNYSDARVLFDSNSRDLIFSAPLMNILANKMNVCTAEANAGFKASY